MRKDLYILNNRAAVTIYTNIRACFEFLKQLGIKQTQTHSHFNTQLQTFK